MAKPLVSICSLDDLARILHTQKLIALRAKKDITALDNGSISDDESLQEFVDQEKEVLQKWADRPTLTEFNLNPSLMVNEENMWGSTFGVAVLVQDLVLEQVYNQQKRLKPLLRRILMLLLDTLTLKEKQNPAQLLGYVIKKIRLSVTTGKGTALSPKEHDDIVHTMMGQMIEAFLAVGTSFGIFDNDDMLFTVTPLGARIYLHMVDIQKFINTMAEAHAAFQKQKPKLSMV